MCHGNDLATASGQPLAACQHSNNLVGRQNTIITIFRKVCRDRDFYFAIHAMQCWPPLDYNVAKCGWLAGWLAMNLDTINGTCFQRKITPLSRY